MATNSEILELLLRITGSEDVAELKAAFAELGTEAGEAAGDAAQLADKLEATVAAADKAGKALELEGNIEETRRQLSEATAGLQALNKAFDATDTSSSKVTAAYRKAEAEIAKLTATLIRQETAFGKTSAQLAEAGVDVSKLASEEARLRTEVERTSAELRGSAESALRAASAQQQLNQRLAAADDDFRRMAKSGQVSAAALDKYRAGAAEAKDAQEKLAASARSSFGIFDRLRGALAGLAVFFGFREAAQGVKAILDIGDAAEKTRIRLSALYGSQAEGNRAFEELRETAKANGLALDGVLDAATKLKTFGLEPLGGALQGLIDQNARLGGSQQTLEGLILAVGQAWAKQKLQGEEILQLVERGVPVWDLLSKATGKSTIELQKLSEQGKLGRDVIKQLLDEIARSSSGAAADNLSTLGGLVQQLRGRFQEFLQSVSDAGVLDYFKQQLASLNAEVQRLAGSGQLKEYAVAVKDAIVGTAEAIRGTIEFVVRYGKEITFLAQAYLALKAAQVGSAVVSGIAALGTASAAAAGGVRTLTTAMQGMTVMGAAAAAARTAGAAVAGLAASLSGFLVAAVAVAGYKAGGALAELFHSLTPAAREARQRVDEAAAGLAAMGEQSRLAAISLVQFEGQVTKTAAEVLAMSEAEREAYDNGQKGLESYLAAQGKYLIALQASGQASQAQIAELAAVRQRLDELRQGYADVAAAAEESAARAKRALDLGVTEATLAVIDQLEAVRGKAGGVGEALSKMFAGVNFEAEAGKLVEIVVALDRVGDSSSEAGEEVRNGLAAELDKLSGQQLKAFQDAAVFAFDTGRASAEDMASVLDTTLQAALQRLGVSAEDAGVGFTAAGKNIIAAFDLIAQNAQATGGQIQAAFVAAVGSAETKAELARLSESLQRAFDAGKISAEQFNAAMDALRQRLASLSGDADKTKGHLKDLGNTTGNTGRELDKTGKEAGKLSGTLEEVDRAADGASVSLGAMSEAAADLYRQINNEAGLGTGLRNLTEAYNRVTQRVNEQRESAARRIEQLDEELARYDPMAQKLEMLRSQYALVDDATLQQIAQREERLERERERLDRESERVAQELQRVEQRDAGGGRAPASIDRVDFRAELVVVNKQRTGDQLVAELSEQAIYQLTQRIMQQLSQMRGVG